MTARHQVVFLVDVDNTLIDNDHITADLKRHLERAIGRERQERYWAMFEALRGELGYADYLGALQRYRVAHPRDPHVLTASLFARFRSRQEHTFAEKMLSAMRAGFGGHTEKH